MTKIVIVSNRLPVSIKKGKKGIEVYPSAGGLATGLSSYASKKNSVWIGWPGITLDEINDQERLEITRKLEKYNCRPVYLTKKQMDEFYSGYSNTLLWPFLHTMKAEYKNQDKFWRTYREVNEIFCEAILAQSTSGSTVWVHDYHLMLLPKLLRVHRPADSVGFFLHIPFPTAEHFAKLKTSGSLIRGLLGADLVGFHTPEYVQGFLDSCAKLTGAAVSKNSVALKDRVVRVAEFPIGIDYLKFSQASRKRAVRKEVRRLKWKYRRKKIILAVDRLDPTKGYLERLNAYQTLLKQSPELHGKVIMVMLAIPSRGDVGAYKKLKKAVENKIKQINKQFGTNRWKPIDYIYENLPFEKFSALYRIADVGFVAPIKDGMNLVAKEFVASQGRNRGMLILSEKAGAAHELKDALLVDPAKPKTLVTALSKAIHMPKRELKQRIKSMQEVISDNTIHTWASGFMTSLKSSTPSKKTPNLTKVRLENLLKNYQSAQKKLLIFDYDGVLAPFTPKPELAKPSKEILKLLRRISKRPDTTLAIVSGRSQKDLENWFGKLPLILAAEHGAVIRRPGHKKWSNISKTTLSWKREVMPILKHETKAAPGSFVEEKKYSLVWHYRSVPGVYYSQRSIGRLKTALKPLLAKYGLKLFRGDKIIEIKDPNLNKGKAVQKLLDKPYDFMMAMGDDFTDEDMFKALPKRAYTFKVGPGKTAARYRLKNTAEVEDLLRSL